jgi:hypothetical protein
MAGCIEIVLSEESKTLCHKVLTQIIDPSAFYISPSVGYISGDVTNEGHVTVFYGFDGDIQAEQMRVLKWETSIISATRFDIFEKDDYDILVLLVDKGPIAGLVEQIRQEFGCINDSLNPHVTLAYIQKGTLQTIPSLTEPINIELARLRFYPDGSDDGIYIDTK